MRSVLAAVSAFTFLACAWMCRMFFVLRHAGFEWRASLSALVMIQSAATLGVLATGSFSWWLRIVLAIGACGLLGLGASAFVANEAASDWEGYVAVISIALAVQGVLTLLPCAYPDRWPRPAAPASAVTRRL